MTGASGADRGRPVLLIADARTGSAWCAQILDSHPDVRFYGEIFRLNFRPGDLDLPQAPPSRRGPSRLPAPPLLFGQYAHQHRGPLKTWRYLSFLLNQPSLPSIVGFKFMYSQCRAYPSLLASASVHRARVIHLVRTNPLQRVMSGYVMRATSVAHTVENLPIPTFRVEPTELISAVRAAERRLARSRALLRAVPVPTIELSYEALRGDPDRTSRRLFEALELEPVAYDPVGKVRKSVNRPYEQIVSNYAEVRAELDRQGISYAL